MWLISGQTTVGTGFNKSEGASSFALYQSNLGYAMVEVSGTPTSSANISLMVSPDPGDGHWMTATSWTTTGSAVASAQFTSFFPFICGQVNWISAGPAAVNLQYVGRKVTF